jgi:hypothetical protein
MSDETPLASVIYVLRIHVGLCYPLALPMLVEFRSVRLSHPIVKYLTFRMVPQVKEWDMRPG